MKAFRGQPDIFKAISGDGKRADLRVNGLTLSFGGVMALNSIDFEVNTGELFAIIGPNGAGKTSLFKTALPDSTDRRRAGYCSTERI